MTPTFLTVVLAAFLSGDPTPTADAAPRKPNPLAPSLPLLTSDEEDQLDKIIDRFMLFDTGELKGDEGKKALGDFEKLGPEAIPALIRGINRAAVMEKSCPTLVIAKKLSRMLAASDDDELLDFAYDNIAAGVDRSQHMAVLQNLRVMCMLRRNALQRLAERTGVKAPHKMTTAELADAMARDSGNRLKMELMELGQRKGPDVLTGLIAAAGNKDQDVQKLARDLMVAQMATQGIDIIQTEMPRRTHRRTAGGGAGGGEIHQPGRRSDWSPGRPRRRRGRRRASIAGEDQRRRGFRPGVFLAVGRRGGLQEVAGMVGQGGGSDGQRRSNGKAAAACLPPRIVQPLPRRHCRPPHLQRVEQFVRLRRVQHQRPVFGPQEALADHVIQPAQ